VYRYCVYKVLLINKKIVEKEDMLDDDDDSPVMRPITFLSSSEGFASKWLDLI